MVCLHTLELPELTNQYSLVRGAHHDDRDHTINLEMFTKVFFTY
jgi:hypothetical protein